MERNVDEYNYQYAGIKFEYSVWIRWRIETSWEHKEDIKGT